MKLSATDIAFEGFRVVRDRPLAVLAWVVLQFVGNLAVQPGLLLVRNAYSQMNKLGFPAMGAVQPPAAITPAQVALLAPANGPRLRRRRPGADRSAGAVRPDRPGRLSGGDAASRPRLVQPETRRAGAAPAPVDGDPLRPVPRRLSHRRHGKPPVHRRIRCCGAERLDDGFRRRRHHDPVRHGLFRHPTVAGGAAHLRAEPHRRFRVVEPDPRPLLRSARRLRTGGDLGGAGLCAVDDHLRCRGHADRRRGGAGGRHVRGQGHDPRRRLHPGRNLQRRLRRPRRRPRDRDPGRRPRGGLHPDPQTAARPPRR